jgi:cytidyltransferase-like protein
MRIAFFGGTFDPPHRGHIAIARAAIARLGLDQVLVAPVATQPLKGGSGHSSFADRLAMVRLAVTGEPGLVASDVVLLCPAGGRTTPSKLCSGYGIVSNPQMNCFACWAPIPSLL